MFDWMLPETHRHRHPEERPRHESKGLFEEFEKAGNWPADLENKDHRSWPDRAENSRHPGRRNLLSYCPRACRTGRHERSG